jgi:hypothetical protein
MARARSRRRRGQTRPLLRVRLVSLPLLLLLLA